MRDYGLTKMKKSQAALEAMIALGVIFILFIGVYGIYLLKNSDVIRSRQHLEEREDCLKMANAITSAFLLKDSATTITIYHELTISPSAQRIETEKASCTFPVKSVYDDALKQEPFTLQPGKITVENKEGMVVIENV